MYVLTCAVRSCFGFAASVHMYVCVCVYACMHVRPSNLRMMCIFARSHTSTIPRYSPQTVRAVWSRGVPWFLVTMRRATVLAMTLWLFSRTHPLAPHGGPLRVHHPALVPNLSDIGGQRNEPHFCVCGACAMVRLTPSQTYNHYHHHRHHHRHHQHHHHHDPRHNFCFRW